MQNVGISFDVLQNIRFSVVSEFHENGYIIKVNQTKFHQHIKNKQWKTIWFLGQQIKPNRPMDAQWQERRSGLVGGVCDLAPKGP